MKVVYSAPNISLVSIFRTLLEGRGFRCWVRNEFLFAGVGEIPPIEAWPQLCVEDEDYPGAKRIVDEALAEKELPEWRCESCDELIEGQFEQCWKCGRSRPSQDGYYR